MHEEDDEAKTRWYDLPTSEEFQPLKRSETGTAPKPRPGSSQTVSSPAHAASLLSRSSDSYLAEPGNGLSTLDLQESAFICVACSCFHPFVITFRFRLVMPPPPAFYQFSTSFEQRGPKLGHVGAMMEDVSLCTGLDIVMQIKEFWGGYLGGSRMRNWDFSPISRHRL